VLRSLGFLHGCWQKKVFNTQRLTGGLLQANFLKNPIFELFKNVKTVTEEQRARFCEIYELYLDGVSLRNIGEKLSISHERVRQILRQGSTAEEYKIIKAASDRRRMRTWQTTEAIALLEAGNSCSKVASILKISVSSIKRLSTQYNKIKRSRT